MTQGLECLVCGRPMLPTGEPACDCLTHSLSRPVATVSEGPDPADVALFPLEPPPPEPPRTPRSHRKPKNRGRAALAAGGTVAAVVGCTALAASLFGGQQRSEEALEETRPGPSLGVPDGDPEPDTGRENHHDARPAPQPTDHAGPPARDTGRDPDAPGNREPAPPVDTSEPPADTTEPSRRTDPPPVTEPPPPHLPPDTGEPSATVDPPPVEDEEPVVLMEGDEGPEVAELQYRLGQLRWVYDGEAHGRFDGRTRAAVVRFQVGYGVEGDRRGVYGPYTRQVLEAHTQQP
ncbi:hypothetical protein GCM10009716_09400 [Streptomyces sodiiphilus]|uniref:Peptidoglycan binding-like domain-containing protein n=1 Tax=Streptomyces sodiiphilus TaxID=226217 RepID=A0ABP5A344_9ACTN